jgi:hypothetical protein
MQHFILDTNIIIRSPDILAKGDKYTRFVIPASVISELASFQSRRSGEQILDLVKNAVKQGVYLLELPFTEVLVKSQLDSIDRLDTDINTVKAVEYYIKQIVPENKEDVYFVTEDIILAKYTRSLGIKTIGLTTLINKLKNLSVTNQDIERSAFSIITRQRRELITGIVWGVIISILGNLFIAKFDVVVNTINIWGTIALIPISSVILYWFRSKNRLFYGITEFLFGFVSTLRVFFPNFSYSLLDTTDFIQIAGSLYIMVRGMDNIGKGLKGTRFEIAWERRFGEA